MVLDLRQANFSNMEISAMFRDQKATVARVSVTEASDSAGESPIQSADVICGVMAWIASVACCIIPGVEPIIAAGQIATVLGDATVKGIADGLIDLGVPNAEACRYEDKIKAGHILMSVHPKSPEKSDEARKILSAAGAEDICTTTEGIASRIPTRNTHGISGATFAQFAGPTQLRF